MAKHVKRSVLPIYLVGVTSLVYALVLPLRRPVHYALCAAVCAVVFVVGKAIFPDKAYAMPGEEKPEKKEEKKEEPKKEEPKSTGNPEIDALLKERERALGEMRRLNDNIADEKISAQIDHLEEVTGRIIDQVVAQPKKLPQIRRFLDYYLPTTLKILNAYDRMDSVGVSGSNIDATKGKVETMMDTIVKAFDRQLDALFGEEALDISTDITVMENLLARGGGGNRMLDRIEVRKQALRQSLTEKTAQERRLRLLLQKAQEESRRRAGETERLNWQPEAVPEEEAPPPPEDGKGKNAPGDGDWQKPGGAAEEETPTAREAEG